MHSHPQKVIDSMPFHRVLCRTGISACDLNKKRHLYRAVAILFSAIFASLAVAQTGAFADRNPRYILQPSDVLEIHYRYSPEFDQTVTVQPDGFVSLQLIGDLKLRGLTVDQAKAAILEKASERLKDPEITVVLKEFEKPYFVVGGEVNTPGRFEMRGSMTALQAIAMAGGFKAASAKHSQVILYRRVGPGLAQTEILDLKAAMNPGSSEPLADLHPGDLLIVPQNRISKIERFVKWGNIGIYQGLP
jgi:polysaccharide export outer membrane protein